MAISAEAPELIQYNILQRSGTLFRSPMISRGYPQLSHLKHSPEITHFPVEPMIDPKNKSSVVVQQFRHHIRLEITNKQHIN